MSDTPRNPRTQAAGAGEPTRREWQEPRLEFVEPKLVKHGDMKALTAQGFIGTFVPQD